jgi:hypothetical protein
MPALSWPGQHTREKQNGLGVEDWDFPSKSKPAARRLSCRFDQVFRHGTIVSGAAAARPEEIAFGVIGRFA